MSKRKHKVNKDTLDELTVFFKDLERLFKESLVWPFGEAIQFHIIPVTYGRFRFVISADDAILAQGGFERNLDVWFPRCPEDIFDSHPMGEDNYQRLFREILSQFLGTIRHESGLFAARPLLRDMIRGEYFYRFGLTVGEATKCDSFGFPSW